MNAKNIREGILAELANGPKDDLVDFAADWNADPENKEKQINIRSTWPIPQMLKAIADATGQKLPTEKECDPRNIKVRVKARNNVRIDDVKLGKDQEAIVTLHQFRALAAHLERLAVLLLQAALALFIVPRSQAQEYKINSISGMTGGTSTIAAESASNYNATISVVKYDYLCLSLSSALQSSGTGFVGVDIDTSNDNTNWCLNQLLLGGPASGTTTNTWTTNINTGAVGYYRAHYGTNANAANTTNVLFTWNTKPSIRGN